MWGLMYSRTEKQDHLIGHTIEYDLIRHSHYHIKPKSYSQSRITYKK